MFELGKTNRAAKLSQQVFNVAAFLSLELRILIKWEQPHVSQSTRLLVDDQFHNINFIFTSWKYWNGQSPPLQRWHVYKGSQTQVKSNLIGAYPYQGDCSSTKLSKTCDNVKISPPYKLILYYYIEIYIYILIFLIYSLLLFKNYYI